VGPESVAYGYNEHKYLIQMRFMFLKRIQVPDFRVLKNIDITFEPDLEPKVFPLGSQNGGGKSTLLQLIFVLLHCSASEKRHIYIQNFLHDYCSDSSRNMTSLAKISLFDEQLGDIKLIFECYTDDFLSENNIMSVDSEGNLDSCSFKYFDEKPPRLDNIDNFISTLRSSIRRIREQVSDYTRGKESFNSALFSKTSRILEDSFIKVYREYSSEEYDEDRKNYFSRIIRRLEQTEDVKELQEILRNLEQEQSNQRTRQQEIKEKYQKKRDVIDGLAENLNQQGLFHICNIYKDEMFQFALVCRQDDVLARSNFYSTMSEISKKVYLAAPSTQIFLFTTNSSRNNLFRQIGNKSTSQSTYQDEIERAKSVCLGLFTYDFLPTKLLLDAFTEARDRDFQERVENGMYGTHFGDLLNKMNSMLSGKTIDVEKDLSGIKFFGVHNKKKFNVYPEDLSHGELKRFSIYMWLMHQKIDGAIILMDEIEIALHPDWQYQIVSDLVEWSPTNQYILATHSYELCQAVTPAHVKEITPNLLPQTV
jgi:ABC-type polar amino acid transport system ATPase subunit